MLPSFIHAVGSLVVIRSSCCPYLVFVPDQSSTCPPLPDSQQQFKLVQWLHFEKFPSNRSSAYFIHRRIFREPSVGCPIRSPRFIRAYVRRFFFFLSPFLFFAFSVVWHGPLGALKHTHKQNINNLGSDPHNYCVSGELSIAIIAFFFPSQSSSAVDMALTTLNINSGVSF